VKRVEVKDQVRLPLSKCVELVFSGVRFRLFRAAVTVTIISLAVAFLMTMLTESLVAREVASAVQGLTADRKAFLFWAGRISSPITENDLTGELAGCSPGGPRWLEFRTWGELDDAHLEKLAAVARTQVELTTYFESLELGQRRPLLGRSEGVDVFRNLQDVKEFERFAREAPNLSRPVPGGVDGFREFLADWQATEADRGAILAGHKQALQAVQERFPSRQAQEILVAADEGMRAELEQMGFRMDREQLGAIREQAKVSIDADWLLETLSLPVFKQRLASRRNVDKVGQVTAQMLFREASSSRGARWVVEQLDELKGKLAALAAAEATLADRQERVEALRKQADPASLRKAEEALQAARETQAKAAAACEKILSARAMITAFNLTPDRVQEVARDRLDRATLADIEAEVSASAGDEGAGLFGFSGRTLWLILVSFLVCIVGIANAMLMSVTERFREIATMKCLGATDGFIMINFVLESCLQGVAGGVVGSVLGLVLGSLRAVAAYGWMGLTEMPVGSVLATAGVAMGVGLVISAMAAVYPAWAAARLAPMEAMRIE